jgi:LPPG:FO 2-phospho-L-lactate transferase
MLPRRATTARVAVLCGGLGGARVALALQALGLADSACFVTNVGDDLAVDGLLVCPDTDAVLYALAGCFDEERGWGVRGDTFGPRGSQELPWFHVGTEDRRHHVARAALLSGGLTLGEATRRLAEGLGVRAAVVPVADAPVRTRIRTLDGVLAWQEWLVREQGEPEPLGVEYVGAERAIASPMALHAIRGAELVLVAPSSPVASIAPILAVPGVVDALAETRVVVLSPVVARRSPVLERDVRRHRVRAALLRTVGVAHDPVGVASWYHALSPTFVLDPADAQDAPAVEALGIEAVVAPGRLTDVEGLRHTIGDIAREEEARPCR